MRDFIIGSILFVLIMQLLPESSEQILTYISSIISFNILSSIPAVDADSLDIEIGIPKF